MRIVLFLIAMFAATQALAAASRHCQIRSADNVTEGCYVLDPAVIPAPPGTFYVPDPDKQGTQGLVYDQVNGVWIIPPLTPEEQAEKDAADAQQARDDELKAIADVQDLADRLKTATPAQIDTWVDNNMNNIAQARTVMKALLKVLAYALRGA